MTEPEGVVGMASAGMFGIHPSAVNVHHISPIGLRLSN
jgi:hypothetical protein